jgi:hypothetical protein
MKMPLKRFNQAGGPVLAAIVLSALAACSTPPSKEKEINDFPTLARVEYVMQCMQMHGGQNYDNLYHCACSMDKLATRINYEDYSRAQTFNYLYSMAGERGGEFRDPPQSEQLRSQLKEAQAYAQDSCFANTVKPEKARPGEIPK